MIAPAHSLTQRDDAFLLTFVDDTEEAPWMVATDRHRAAIDAFFIPLHYYASRVHPEWYVSSELFIRFARPDGTTGQVAPDTFVVRARRQSRRSFDLRRTRVAPLFVLEVVSPESKSRDEQEKVRLYDWLGVQEYAIFDPNATEQHRLKGHHRDAHGDWAPWPVGRRGDLQSAVLGLTLVPEGRLLRLEDAEGQRLRTAPEEARAREAAEAARRKAESRLAAVEAELAQLRQSQA